MWNEVIYQPGELRIVAYKEGNIIGEKSVKTADKPDKLKLTPDREVIKADGNDLSYILIEAFDKEGIPCPLAMNKVDITLTGAGKIAGVGNGNPQSMNSFKSNSINLFYGKAMLIVGSEFSTGKLIVEATSKGLEDTRVTIKIE